VAAGRPKSEIIRSTPVESAHNSANQSAHRDTASVQTSAAKNVASDRTRLGEKNKLASTHK